MLQNSTPREAPTWGCADWQKRLSLAYPSFRCMKRPGVFRLPLDGMLVERRVTPTSNLLVPIYTPGWREAL